MNRSTHCPDVHTLRGLITGRLVAAEARGVGDHLAACGRCRGRLEGLEATFKEFVPGEEGWTATGMDATLTDAGDGREDWEADLDLSFLDPSEWPGSRGRIGDYHVLGLLGRGGMGIVLGAFDESLERPVAVKVLSPKLASNQRARKRFLREARAAAAINHPNVVTIHAVGVQREMPYLVMEFLRGRSLRERIRNGPPPEPAEILRIGFQIAQGLAAAHDQGVIHRDIKPANIMLEEGVERVKITDFGLALAAMQGSDLTSLDQMVGTPAYMSPEQVKGEPVDPRSDLFGLGCVLYALIAGASPFKGAHTLDVIHKVADRPHIPIQDLAPETPGYLCAIIDRLLQKDSNRRYASAAELAETLRRHLADVNQAPVDFAPGVKPPRDDSELPSRPRIRRRTAVASAGVILAAVLLLGFGIASWYRAWKPEPAKVRPAPLLLTVAKTGKAGYRSLSETLPLATAGSTIRVLDDATYEEALSINALPDNVTIEAPGGATLAPQAGEAVLTIQDTKNLTVRGLRIKIDEPRHGIDLYGLLPGLLLDDIRVFREDMGRDFGEAIFIHKGVSGAPDRPLVLRKLDLDVGPMGIGIYGEGTGVRFIHIEGCTFRAIGTCPTGHVGTVVFGKANDLRFVGNIFEGCKAAVNLKLTPSCKDLVVANNTFAGSTFWIGLVDTVPQPDQVRVCNNLILGSKSVEWQTREQLVAAPAAWKFERNRWELSAETEDDAGLGGRIADLDWAVKLLSRDPKSKDYLRPAADSPLASEGVGGAFARYIGAVPPADEPQRVVLARPPVH